jgi:DNA-binding MarR family transcriptional regulator
MNKHSSKEESLGRWISVIHRYGHSYLEKQRGTLGISHGHVAFLVGLYHRDDLSQEELSESLGLDKTTTARAIKKLIERGYVSISPDLADKRINRLHLTAKGNNTVPKIMEFLKRWTTVLSQGFSKDEKEILLGSLKRMAENARIFKENNFI